MAGHGTRRRKDRATTMARRLGSLRLGSLRLGPLRLGSPRIGSPRLGSPHPHSTP